MELEQLRNETQNLTQRVTGINDWIKSNPQVTDPNAYEIMDCNVSLAEVFSEYAKIDTSRILQKVASNHPEIEPCYFGVIEMDKLRDTANHPFFQSPEANDLYCAVKRSQLSMGYDVPTNPETRRIKKELLCKSMSVPFSIWQVQSEKPDYEYDNAAEFRGMKAMLDIYKSEGNTQFVPEIEAMFDVIEKNYKYSNKKADTKHA